MLRYTAGNTNDSNGLWSCPTMPPTWSSAAEEVDDSVVSSYGIAEDTFWEITERLASMLISPHQS